MRRCADRLEIIMEITTSMIRERIFDLLLELHDLQETERSLVNYDGCRVTAFRSLRVLSRTLSTPSQHHL